MSTTLPGSVQAAAPGLKGFDANTPISASAAQAFLEKGYRFVVRYVGRTEMKSYDLSAAEANTILQAGLGLMVVQHVLNPGWNPTGSLGTQYGTNAAGFAQQLGFPPGVNVWCDLECVADGTAASDVVAYCNNWHDQVAAAGYVPGLYVGYEPGLTGQQLYSSLKFKAYWAAYNVDVSIPTRGWQLVQKVGTGGTIAGISTESYDDDVTQTDHLGGQALWLSTGG
ncbi:MAG TPA: DUF1906 domain-containing protein [Longimicrobiaceae bacterium]|nr:DUF1906 domain-containing protein [Longimicrobiaceae bacterium]